MTLIKKHIDNSLSVKLEGKKESIYELENLCEEIGDLWNLNSKNRFTLNLLLEEIISNIIFYGFDNSEAKYIEVVANKEGDLINVQISDNGIPFNMLEIESKPKEVKLEEKEVGGLGIHLVKNLSESIDYMYQNGKNVLTIQINIS